MSRIISFVNQAGGMGKTTLTASAGYHLVKKGHTVLLIDMDAQGSLTRYLGLEPNDLNSTIADALIDETPAPIHKNWYGVDLVPANTDLAAIYTELLSSAEWQVRLRETLANKRQTYSFILIDCPPNLGPLSIMSLIASTHLMIPVRTNSKGLEGAEDLRDTIVSIQKGANPRLRVAGAIPTMFDTRAKHDKDHLEEIRDEFGKLPVLTPIPKATDFDNTWRARQPLAVFNKNHIAITPLEKLADFLEHC